MRHAKKARLVVDKLIREKRIKIKESSTGKVVILINGPVHEVLTSNGKFVSITVSLEP